MAVPSVAYGVMRGGETLALGAFGLADKAGIPATTKTPYSMASITKPMTSTAVMLLAERGLVDLDAPIDRYLPEPLVSKAGTPQEATVRRVADHTAGLPLHYQFYYADEPDQRPPFAETIRRYGKTFTAPGEKHHYSNLGYGMLDALIERVSHGSYAEFMAEAIFSPLGMEAVIGAPEQRAVPYGPDGVGYPPYDFDHPGGSAAYASVEDLLAFGRFHLSQGPSLLSIESRNNMQQATAQIEESRGYGFGWGVSNRHGRKIVQHTGGMGGVNTILRLVPELDLVIAVLVNGQSELPFRAADDALAALDPIFAQGLETERAKPKLQNERTPVPTSLQGGWNGTIETYKDFLPFSLEIQSGTEALARLDGQESFVEDLALVNGRLVGVFDGDVRTEDAARQPYRIHLDLGHSQSEMIGAAVTISRPPSGEGGAKGKRLGNALAYWTEAHWTA
ncbi:class A beta-lactamase-related serine hydrolase [bacterium]|nr:MAG: class A beta-lactamase-related serine hydrolase [bacterium]